MASSRARSKGGARDPRTTPGAAADLISAYGLDDASLEALITQFDTTSPEYLKKQYMGDAPRYARERLGVQWWSKQEEIATALETHRRVLVKASHSVGKTYFAAGYVLYYFETRSPSIILTTAPTFDQVVELLWKNIRAQAPPGTPLFPAAPMIQDPGEQFHYAKGYTARTADSFQGRHEEDLLIVFDEAVGVHPSYWDAAEGMLTSPRTRMLAICNPTDTSSAAYEADLDPNWHTITISALDHPNIAASLAGQPPPFPGAVNLEWVDERINRPSWATPLGLGDVHLATDIEWPPHSGQWYRPGSAMESRLLGRWPSQGLSTIWSQAAWEAATTTRLPEPKRRICEIGCDVARYGDDNTTIHVRRGGVSLHHETHNGWDTSRTARRLRELADQWGHHCGTEGRRIPVKIDDTGVGGGVIDQREGYLFIGVNASSEPLDYDGYPNRRSELWFAAADRAATGHLDVSRLPQAMRETLRKQLMAPTYKLDNRDRRVVEAKDETKKRLKRSPDDADGFNLAYAPTIEASAHATGGIVLSRPQTEEALLAAYLTAADERSKRHQQTQNQDTDDDEGGDDYDEMPERERGIIVATTAGGTSVSPGALPDRYNALTNRRKLIERFLHPSLR